MTLLAELTAAPEAARLDTCTTGPTEGKGSALPAATRAPDG
jgi:hypothetical protein